MTGNKISELKRVWKLLVDMGKKKLGVILFRNVLIIEPSLQKQFKAFKDIDGNYLNSVNVFKAHSVKFINAITDGINLLDEPEKLKVMLNKLGVMHEELGVPEESFPVFGNALNATLKAILDKDCQIEIINFFSLF